MTVLRTSVLMLLVLTVLTGLLYPLAVTGIAEAIFPAQAGGSLIVERGKVTGSMLIGREFTGPRYFWGRPSATEPFPYNPAASSGSNHGPLSAALKSAVGARRRALVAADPGSPEPPADLLTASASGLDPHISPEAARFQAPRVARMRGLDPAAVARLIEQYTARRALGFLGEPAVNVLALNRALDGLGAPTRR